MHISTVNLSTGGWNGCWGIEQQQEFPIFSFTRNRYFQLIPNALMLALLFAICTFNNFNIQKVVTTQYILIETTNQQKQGDEGSA